MHWHDDPTRTLFAGQSTSLQALKSPLLTTTYVADVMSNVGVPRYPILHEQSPVLTLLLNAGHSTSMHDWRHTCASKSHPITVFAAESLRTNPLLHLHDGKLLSLFAGHATAEHEPVNPSTVLSQPMLPW